MIIGNIVVAFGYEHQWNWKAIVFIGYTAAGIQVAALPAIVTTYAIDSYKPVAGSLMVSATINKNVWGELVFLRHLDVTVTDGSQDMFFQSLSRPGLKR